MSYSFSYNPDFDLIESVIDGPLAFSEVKEFIIDIIKLACEKNCHRLLNDYRQAELKLTTGEIYLLPNIMKTEFNASGLNVSRFRRALIVAKDLRDFRFFETVTLNSGQNAKLFYDVEEARKWVLE